MGGVFSSGASAHLSQYDKLSDHRNNLYQRQVEYQQQAERLKRQAQSQLATGNTMGAISLGRSAKTALDQAAVVGGIICNLDAQRASMETKALTDETVKVLSSCVKHMGPTISVSKVESTLDIHDDAQTELKEIADLLSCPISGGSGKINDEDEILQMLNAGIDANKSAKAEAGAAALPPPPLYFDEDEAFLTWARLQLADVPPDTSTLLPDTTHFPILNVPQNTSSKPSSSHLTNL